MGKVTTDENGVQKLTGLANLLEESSEQITSATTTIQSSFEEKRSLLGPHINEISEIIETIQTAQKDGHESVLAVQNNLLSVASAISEFIASGFAGGGSQGKP